MRSLGASKAQRDQPMSAPNANEQRGLMLISALINFADWLDSEGLLTELSETERAQLVLRFFDAHQKSKNYFMQAEQIVKILGKPFVDA
jgi:hypothetical protein